MSALLLRFPSSKPGNGPPGFQYKHNAGYYMVCSGNNSGTYTDTTVTPNVTYNISGDLATGLNTNLPAGNAILSGVFACFKWPALEPGAQGRYTFDGSATDPILSSYLAIQGAWRKARGIARGDQARFGFGTGAGCATSASNNTAATIATYDFAGSAGPVPAHIRQCAIASSGTYGTACGKVTNYLGSGKTVGYEDVYNNVGHTLQANGPTIWNPGGGVTRYYYGIQAGASGQCGHAYEGWNGSNFLTIYPTTWEQGTAKSLRNLIAAYSVYKLPYTDSSGNVTWYTLDLHPLFEFPWFLDETSANFGIGPITPVSIDSANYPVGNQLSATGYWASYDALMATMYSLFPHTEWGVSMNWTFLTGHSDDDTNTSYNVRLPQISAAYPNICLCPPDTFDNSWGPAFQASNAQQAFIGLSNPGTVPGVPVLSGCLINKMSYAGQGQGPDWNAHLASGHTANTLAVGAGILASNNGHGNTPGQLTMGGSRFLMWNIAQTSASPSNWIDFMYPSMVTASTTTPVNLVRPSNLN